MPAHVGLDQHQDQQISHLVDSAGEILNSSDRGELVAAERADELARLVQEALTLRQELLEANAIAARIRRVYEATCARLIPFTKTGPSHVLASA